MIKKNIHLILIPIILIWVLGLHFEDYEGTVNAWFDGRLLGEAYTDFSLYALFYLGDWYSFLYKTFPQVPFLPIISTIVSLYSMLLLISIIRVKEEDRWFEVLLILLLASTIVFISNTRFTFLAGSVGATYLLMRPHMKMSWLFAVPIMLYGCLYRYETGLMGVGLTILYLSLSGLATWGKAKYAYMTIAALITFVYVSHIRFANEVPYLKQLHYLTYFTANSENHSIQVVDKKDTLFQEALYNYFYEDTAFFNKKVTELPQTSGFLLKKAVILLNDTNTIINAFIVLFNTPEFYVFFVSFFFLLGVKEIRTRILLINILALAGLLFIVIIVRVEIRFIVPYLIVCSFINMLWFIYTNKNHLRKNIYMATLSLLLFFVLKNITMQVAEVRQTEKNNKLYIETLNKLPQKLVALNLNSINIFNTGVFDRTRLENKEIFFADAADVGCIPTMSDIIRKKFHINSMDSREIYGYLIDNPDAIFLSSDERVAFVGKYMSTLYDIHIDFVKLDVQPFSINMTEIYLYQLKSMPVDRNGG